MSDQANNQTFQLSYGRGKSIEFTVAGDRVVWQHFAVAGLEDVGDAVEQALTSPIDFPALSVVVIPDDNVVIAAEPETPGLSTTICCICTALVEQGVQPTGITILQRPTTADPRADLPDEIREGVRWVQHDASDKNALAYLASTTGGDRIQLARLLTDADVVLSVGRIGFDSVLGYRGTNSAFYPALSTTDAIEKARGQGHGELEPEDTRPLRQVVDEVGWLLGTQFTVQTLPGRNNSVAKVLAGAIEPTMRRGREFLDSEFTVTPDERADLVVATITDDAGGHSWNQLAASLATAQRLVARDGKILILSQVQGECGVGIETLRQVETPADALKPLRLGTPEDIIAATQIAAAVQWANVYLLSDLDENVVDDVFMFPLGEVSEAIKLIENTPGKVTLIEDAHNVHARISSGD